MTDCPFCRIVGGDTAADIVYESASSVAFRDTNPQAPTHVLVVPKVHHRNAAELAEREPGQLADLVLVASAVAHAERIDAYRLVFNTGAAAGQSVWHTHLHLLGGRDLTWPPG
ncbi:MAG: HIT domain-containing protein [Nocardioides sp.]